MLTKGAEGVRTRPLIPEHRDMERPLRRLARGIVGMDLHLHRILGEPDGDQASLLSKSATKASLLHLTGEKGVRRGGRDGKMAWRPAISNGER